LKFLVAGAQMIAVLDVHLSQSMAKYSLFSLQLYTHALDNGDATRSTFCTVNQSFRIILESLAHMDLTAETQLLLALLLAAAAAPAAACHSKTIPPPPSSGLLDRTQRCSSQRSSQLQVGRAGGQSNVSLSGCTDWRMAVPACAATHS
jgi:hypothetical protein